MNAAPTSTVDPLSALIRSAVKDALDSAGVAKLPRLMDREQAAEYLSVEPRTVDRLFHLGKIPRVTVTERVFRYDRKALDTYIEENQ
jgi:excisionase family DNA binding protein